MKSSSQEIDIYNLIVETSKSINTLIRREKRKKFPECVSQIQQDLMGKTIAADVIPVMHSYIAKANRDGH